MLDPDLPSDTEWIAGIPLSTDTMSEAVSRLLLTAREAQNSGAPPLIYTSANGQVLSEAARSDQLAQLLRSASGVSPDGQSLVFASKLLGERKLRERVATTDLFPAAAQAAEKGGETFYLLGASEVENARATAAISRSYPNLRIVGRHNGYFQDEQEIESIVDDIARLKPTVLWLCLGFPSELEFAFKWKERLTGVGAIKTSGGLLNYFSGTRPRAPTFLQKAGLEWAWRLALEPRRLFKRYLITNIHTITLLLRMAKGPAA